MDVKAWLLVASVLGTVAELAKAFSVHVEGYMGAHDLAGRLIVCHDQSWGTVCDDNFDYADAVVFCRMMGYYGHAYYENQAYGAGSGFIWLSNVGCSGWEMTVDHCYHQGWGMHACTHSEDVSVRCHRGARLVGGPDSMSGRLEVYYADTWGTVCDDGFTHDSAAVFCKMLGFRGPATFLWGAYGPGEGTIWLDQVSCMGHESYVEQCSKNPWGTTDCSHAEDVSIQCTHEPVFSECKQQTDQFNNACGTMSCNKIIDNDVTSCVPVSYDQYPWFLNAATGINKVWKFCGPLNIPFSVTGKGFSCSDGQVELSFHGDHGDVSNLSGNFKLCSVTSEHKDDVTQLVTCRYACEATELSPKIVLIHAMGPGVEICELTQG